MRHLKPFSIGLNCALGADLMIQAMPMLFGMEDYDCIVPVPLHKRRKRKRGYNQVELIGERLSKAINIPMELHNLVKTVNTPPQVGLPRKERQRNSTCAFWGRIAWAL